MKRARSPPGPTGLPLVGSLLTVLKQAATSPRFHWHLMFNSLRAKYGDVLSMQVGSQEFVLLSGYNKIKSACIDQASSYSHRPNNKFYQLLAKGRGIIFSEGQLWREQRRFALRVLRDFGLGRSVSERQVQQEAEELVAVFVEQDGCVIDVKEPIAKAVINVIASMVFNERSGYEDKQLLLYLQHAAKLTQTGIVTLLLAMFPWLPESLFGLFPSSREFVQSEDWVMQFCETRIETIRQRFKPDSGAEPNCFVEAYLLEQQQQQQQQQSDDSSSSSSFDNHQLLRTVFDLFLAGSDTTANTLRWALLYAALNQPMQQRCFEEIAAGIGSRQVCMMDKRCLHYVQAFIDETQRICTLVPMAVEHRCPEDTEIEGRIISKDAIVYMNLYSVLHDPALFPEPEQFNPERFLDPSTGHYKPSEHLIPFGIGRRACLGEMLARMELFILFTSLLQRLQFLPTEATLANREAIEFGLDGIVHTPAQHSLIVKCRH